MTGDPRWAPPPSECLSSDERRHQQFVRLTGLLGAVDGTNRFYTEKFLAAGVNLSEIRTLEDLARLPLTTKQELASDQAATPPWGTAHTEPLTRYTRYHQTSSTTGPPLRWLDTPESWRWVADCWRSVFHAARIGNGDTILFPFGFGPFLGFWSAFDAATQLGARVVPAGGMSSETRLKLLDAVAPEVVCCTPTYALRLLEVARTMGLDLPISTVRTIVVAGEPGGSIDATRRQIEQGWGARVIDHHGLTEVGPVSFECWEHPGALHLNETQFICELLDPGSDRPAAEGEPGELVVTNLGRIASPVIRYRTRDIVRLRSTPCACGRTLRQIEGGVLSRADDMVCVRGVNVYPVAIEALVRQVTEVTEFRSTVNATGPLHELSIEVEVAPTAGEPETVAARVGQVVQEALGLTVPVCAVDAGTLPRFELKSRRFVVKDSADD